MSVLASVVMLSALLTLVVLLILSAWPPLYIESLTTLCVPLRTKVSPSTVCVAALACAPATANVMAILAITPAIARAVRSVGLLILMMHSPFLVHYRWWRRGGVAPPVSDLRPIETTRPRQYIYLLSQQPREAFVRPLVLGIVADWR